MEDHAIQEIKDGVTLIKAVKEIQPELKILVFSAEGRPEVISSLITDLGIDAYVRKARHDVQELRSAIEAIAKGRSYFPIQSGNRHEKTIHLFLQHTIQLLYVCLPKAQNIGRNCIEKAIQFGCVGLLCLGIVKNNA